MVLDRARQSIAHHRFSGLPELLRAGDLLVVNDTRVMAARLRGVRPDTGGEVEALLVRPLTDTRWEALFRPGRQAVPGRRFEFRTPGGPLAATVVYRADRLVMLEFERAFDPSTRGRSAAAALHPRLPAETRSATRPSTAAKRAAPPRRRPGCTSPRSCWSG